MRKCCANCFGDTFLTQQIELLALETGNCEFCLSLDVKLVEPFELIDRFETVFGLYEESTNPGSSSIESLLRMDWELFAKLDSVKAEMLLGLIFNNIDMLQKNFAPVIQHDASAVQEWEDFREELKHRNRFFPKNIQATKQLKELFGLLVASTADIPIKVYRARMCEQPQPYALDQMGTPPAVLTGNGRANPVGIPCLYVASDTTTAIAEIRPHKGEMVCVAEFEVDKKIKLADLRYPRKTISPFLLSEEQIKLLRRYMEYLCRLSEELTMPVLPKSAHLEYLPSQYLCEFIKHCGFDGLIYTSAMGAGINYAIFNSAKVIGVDVHQYQIDKIAVGFSECRR
ncbi:MAG: hypothetical protein A2511_09775 [Deltaproteobacteria bacterium RIFOXYD12_FULL_50_9]|nr:MAG: hypothetical protein A2511_09775 [Deltaproteobacteria bacterium RIFOXYD12_FULL_50_9]